MRLQSKREFTVEAHLEGEFGVEAFVPTYTEDVKWSDRTKRTTRPLFPGYIFVSVDRLVCPPTIAELLAVPGVIQALPSNLEPALIDEREIENLKLALAAGRDAKPAAQCPYVAGEPVTIATGPLAGVTGFVTRTQGICRVFVDVTILNRAVSVGVDAADLKKTKE